MKVPMDHPALLWLIEHTASILNRFVVGSDGQTAYQRLHGRRANKKAVEFGEKLFYEHAMTNWDVLGWHRCLANKLLGHGMEMSSALDLLFGLWNLRLVKLKGTPSKPIHSCVDRYGRIEECEDPHAMFEVDPEKHAR